MHNPTQIEGVRNNQMIREYEHRFKIIVENSNEINQLVQNDTSTEYVPKGRKLDELIKGNCNEAEKKYLSLLTRTMENEYIEEGYKSDSQYIYENIVNTYGKIVASRLLNKIYLKNARNSKVIISILYLIAAYDDQDFIEWNSAILSLGLLNTDYEIKDLVLQCYERWENPEYIEFLKSLEMDVPYLEEYRNQIIESLTKIKGDSYVLS